MKRKPMKRERAYVVIDGKTGLLRWEFFTREGARKEAARLRKSWLPHAYVRPVNVIPAKGRKG